MRRVMIIAPHMDDEVLGCGGTIAKHVEQGDAVDVCIVCNRAYGRAYEPVAIAQEAEDAEAARKILGYAKLQLLGLPDERLYAHVQEVLDALERVIQAAQPEIVYTSYAGDLHQDHRVVGHASNIALRAAAVPFVRRILAYEVPSGTEQAFPGVGAAFTPTVFTDIAGQLERKLAAMAAYKRESRPFPHPRSPEMLRARAQVRGAQCGAVAAEAFMVLRELG